MFRALRKLFRFITWPIVALFDFLILGLLKLAEWGIELFLKVGDKVFTRLAGNNITLDKDDPKSKEINKFSHNIDAIIQDMWVHDKKIEKLLGTSILTEDLVIPETLTIKELQYCYNKSLDYNLAAPEFANKYLAEFSKLSDEYLQNTKARLRGEKVKSKHFKGRYFNDRMFQVRYIRRLWKKTLRDTKKHNNITIIDRELLVSGIQANMTMTKLTLNKTFLAMYEPMLYMGVNFYGDKIPLYNI